MKEYLTKEQKKMIPLYRYNLEWSDEDQLFVVSVEELEGCMSHGKTPEEAIKMGFEAVESHLEGMAKDKEELPLPLSRQKFKGEFLVRAEPQLHKQLVIKSKKAGYKTLNKFLVAELTKIAK